MSYDLKTLRGDLYGGTITAVVSLPLALAFGVTSGLGASAGVYGLIALGCLAALIGGTPGQMSGPTGPMAVAIAAIYVSQDENVCAVLTIIIMAGLIQVILGLSRAGRFIAYTPYSVISGFMSGIGIIIIIINILPFLGEPVVEGGVRGALRALPNAAANFNMNGFLVAILTLLVAVAWPRRLDSYIPGYLVAIVVGAFVGEMWLTGEPVIGPLEIGWPDRLLPDLSVDSVVGSLQPAMVLALLGSIDSLVTSLTTDAMTGVRHNPDRELLGQGVGNTVAGLVGGLPGAGSTMETMTNLRSGGRTRVSGLVRALVIVGVIVELSRFIESVPHAAIAGILVKVGWDSIDWRFIVRCRHIQKIHLTVMLITMGLTVFVDVVAAVAMGLIVAGMTSARQMESLQLDSVISAPLLDRSFLDDDGASTGQEEPGEGDEDEAFSARAGLIKLRGNFSVASSNKLVESIGTDIEDHEIVILDFSETVYMDDSAAMVVEQMIDIAAEENTECIVMGLQGMPAEVMAGFGVFRRVPAEHFVENLDEARAAVRRILERKQTLGD